MVLKLGRAVFALILCCSPSFALAAPGRDAGVAAPDAGRPAHRVVIGPRPVRPGRTKGPKAPRNPVVELYQVNLKEGFHLRFADERGRPIAGWQKRFQRFMRCHYTNTQHRIDPRLPRLIYQTGRHFPGHRIEVISGYRSPKVARNPRSPHKLGLACDFRIPGVSNATLRDFLRKSFDHVGVGYYPNSSFVHLDVRGKGPSAFWIDYSGPGEGAVYSRNARDDLRTGRADRYRPEGDGLDRAESEDDLLHVDPWAAGAGGAGGEGTPQSAAGEAVRR